MNQVSIFTTTNASGEQVMSSIDMVAYINASREPKANGKLPAVLRHSDFLEKVVAVLGTTSAKFSVHVNIPGPNGASRMSPAYAFPEREAKLMAMSYSYELQAAVYDAWKAAEAKLTTFQIPQTFSQALLLASKAEEAKEIAILQLTVAKTALQEAAPKIEFHDAVVADTKVETLGNTAKLLGVGRTSFINWLKENKYVQKDRVPYQSSIDAGFLEVSFAPQYVTSAGKVCPRTTYVTGKGIVHFQKKMKKQDSTKQGI